MNDPQSTQLKGRAREIYLDLCEYLEDLPAGCALPPLRELKLKYAAGQGTVVAALDMLAKRNNLERIPRKKIKVAASTPDSDTPSVATYDGFPWLSKPINKHYVLTTTPVLANIWQPIVDRFNLVSPHSVRINTIDFVNGFSARMGSGDFILFPTNPILHGLIKDTLRFMDLHDLAASLGHDEIYETAFVRDPDNRLWGIAPTLSPSLVVRNNHLDESLDPDNSLDWDFLEFGRYLENLRDEHRQLRYIYSPLGYVTHLSNWGISLVASGTGKVRLDPELLSEPLAYLSKMFSLGIMPAYSDVYERGYGEFFNQAQAVLRDCFPADLAKISDSIPSVEILALPSKDKKPRRLYSEMFSIMADTMNYEKCWDFIRYAMSTETQQYLADHRRNFPSRKGITLRGVSERQSELISQYLERCERRVEDYHIPFQAALVMEVGIDRWLKHGTGFSASILKDIERSCQWRIDHLAGSV